MLTARRLVPAAALTPFAAMLWLLSAADVRAQGESCERAAGIAVLPSPVSPWKGAPLRVLFTAEKPVDGELSLIGPDGAVAARSAKRYGGPPYFWIAEVASPAPGKWRAMLSSAPNCAREIEVAASAPRPPSSVSGSVWPLRGEWNRATENLFSAFIEKLFDDPIDASPSWPALHFVLRDRERNILFNHLGLREDEMKTVLRPDCADLPYFLRAYFAYKLGLPFGFSKCSRGGGGKGPTCPQWGSIQNASYGRPAPPPGTEGLLSGPPAPMTRINLAAAFGPYARVIADGVHSGSARTALADNNTDYYPVSLSQETLRPGVVYADPYGHILMLTKRLPQTANSAGLFFAVDGQPDGTVARKRFWRGNFLFAQDRALGGPGFKRFRPVMRGTDGVLRRLTNDQIARNPHYADFSLEQAKLDTEAFYDRMDDVMSPQPLDPERAMKEAIDALEEQVKARVTSVENGRKYQNSGRGLVNMPDGPSIFETIGPWEDFSTPARDLRLLIAIDVVRFFPERVARRPDRYAMPMGRSVADVKAQLQQVLARELTSRSFSYPRSDGSPWTLKLADVIERAEALEMAYNPNDCVELRWAAPGKSQEAATCKRSAPQAQRAKMTKYRPWFTERRRPARG